MHLKIERGNDVDAELYEVLGAVVYCDPPHTLDTAYQALCDRFGPGHARYRFYRGGNHIAVNHQHHSKRLAIISK